MNWAATADSTNTCNDSKWLQLSINNNIDFLLPREPL